MNQESSKQIVHLQGIVRGHIIEGTVSFSPAPEPGVMTELAKFEAQRILTNMVEDDIDAGKL